MRRCPDRICLSATLIIAVLLLLAQVWAFRGFKVDDAYITFRYVQQWTRGHGLVYNLGQRVEGYSNYLWIMLLAPFDCLGVDLMLAAKGLGVLLSLSTMVLTLQFGRRVSLLGIAPLLLAASGPFAVWAVGGLETPLFTFLLALGGFAFVREEEASKGWFSGPVLGLLALARPDGLVLGCTAVVFRAWRLHRARARPRRHDLKRAFGFVAVVLPYFAWRTGYYGYLLPNTVYAKSLGLHPRALLEGA